MVPRRDKVARYEKTCRRAQSAAVFLEVFDTSDSQQAELHCFVFFSTDLASPRPGRSANLGP